MNINIYITTQEKDNQIYYGSLLQWRYHQKILIKGFNGHTDNKVALEGLIDTLKTIHDKNKRLKIDTDNKYIYDTIKYKRYNSWYESGWERSDGDIVSYSGEWQLIRSLINNFDSVRVNKPFPKRIELLKHKILEEG